MHDAKMCLAYYLRDRGGAPVGLPRARCMQRAKYLPYVTCTAAKYIPHIRNVHLNLLNGKSIQPFYFEQIVAI